MDLFPFLLALGLIALFLGIMARAARLGRFGFGEGAIDRADRPAEFWFYVTLEATLFPAVIFALFYEFLFDKPLNLPVGTLGLAAAALFGGIKALRTGEALDHSFSRIHEPRQYWALVAGCFAVAAPLIAAAIWQVRAVV